MRSSSTSPSGIVSISVSSIAIAALNDSYTIFRPGEIMSSGDVASLATSAFAAAFRIGIQLSAPFLVFGLIFNLGLGLLANLHP